MATAMLSPLEQRLRTEIEQELRASLGKQLEADAARRIASAEEDAERRYRDRLGAYQKDVEADLEHRATEQAQRLWEERRDQYVARMEQCREDLDTALHRCTILEHGLLAVIQSVFPEPDRYRALARHVTLDSLDMTVIAPALRLLGLRLSFKLTESEHTIQLHLEGGVKIVHLCALKKDLPLSVDDRREETAIDAPAHV